MSKHFYHSALALDRLKDITAEADGVWGVFAQRVADPHPLVAINADELFPAASVIKIPILVELYRQAIEEKLDLSGCFTVEERYRTEGSGILAELSSRVVLTLKDLAILMMQLSDNTAATMLLALLGREKINRTMTWLGLPQTQLRLERIDPTLLNASPELAATTPRETGWLLFHLAKEDILTPPACREILAIMQHNLQNRQRLCGLLPFRPDLLVYHKTGTLAGVDIAAGLLRVADEQYVITIFTKNVADSDDPHSSDQTELAMAEISRCVFDYLAQ